MRRAIAPIFVLALAAALSRPPNGATATGQTTEQFNAPAPVVNAPQGPPNGGPFAGPTQIAGSQADIALPTQPFAPTDPPPQVFTNAQIIARIGTETLLASDIMPQAEEALNQQMAKLTPEQRDEFKRSAEYERAKWIYTRKLLEQLVETKMLYADALAKVPKENLPNIRNSINEQFDKTRLKPLMERYGATTRTELEAKMAEGGQSLDRARQLYFEMQVAGYWYSQHVKKDKEIPISQVLGYYQQHIADFEYPAKARWEQLMVSFDRYNSKPEAYRALAEMGNDVLRGADFVEVAKKRSHGPTAAKGGAWDWTTKGSLVSKLLDEAVFGLPVGGMSQILEDDKGFHIVRVVERVDAGCKPFLEAQVEIRDKLREEQNKRDKDEFLAKIRQRTPVWSIFDSPESGLPGAGEALGAKPSTTGTR